MATANPWLSGAGFDAYRNAGWRYLGLAAVAVVLAVEIVAKASGAGSHLAVPRSIASYVNEPVAASVLSGLKAASQDGLTFKGGPPSLATAALVSTASGAVKGGPTVFYQGANFCPYCAAERWSIVLSLLRFGSFSGLRYMASNPNDVEPNTPTFTFDKATYASAYVHFDSAETVNRTDTAYLQTPSKANNAAFNAYNTTKYVGAAANHIPFLDVANRYVWVGAPYVPTDLAATAWPTIATELVNAAKTGQGNANIQAILRGANMYTAAICSADGQKPAAVCSAPGVVAARGDLPK